MISRKLPLRATNFGEWLASLGLLQLVTAVADETPKLSFEDDGGACLHSSASESDLVSLLIDSTDLTKICVHYYASAPGKTATSTTVSIGDGLYHESSFALGNAANLSSFEKTAEAKDGCPVTFAIGRGIFVRHFLGKALCELADLRSPVKTWSGRVEFPRIFLSIREKVAKNGAGDIDSLLSALSRETQRFRFDHAWEDYFDDGCASLEEGAQMRPAVEWLAFMGLSFFPPEWGWSCLSPRHNTLRSFVWKSPLDTTSLTLALHSGQLKSAAEFQVVVGGQFEPKKIRYLTSLN